MAGPTESGGGLRLPLLVQVAVVAAVGLYGATVVRNWSAPSAAGASSTKQQRVYAIGPGIGSNTELKSLLDEGWRVTHVATSSCTVKTDNTVYAAFLMEHKETKEQDFLFMDPRNKAGRESMQAMAEKAKQGYRVVQMVCAAAPEGGELRDHTVFVLEK